MKTLIFFLLGICCLLFSSCSYLANRPLQTLEYRYDKAEDSDKLFVFMRGLGGSNRSFADAGMVEEIQRLKAPFDAIAPNAHFAYYSERTLIDRLREDVILPAKRRGYTTIWLIGVSMGGLGSMLYLKDMPAEVDGVYLIAPFLGYDEILDEIIGAGGVRLWRPGSYDKQKQWQRMFWHWIQEHVADGGGVPIFLGFGLDDEYTKGQELFATVLPPERVIRIEGDHDIDTIASLWRIFLERRLYEGR